VRNRISQEPFPSFCASRVRVCARQSSTPYVTIDRAASHSIAPRSGRSHIVDQALLEERTETVGDQGK